MIIIDHLTGIIQFLRTFRGYSLLFTSPQQEDNSKAPTSAPNNKNFFFIMFSLLVTFRTITIKNDFCYVQTIGITYTYNGGKIQDAINDD